MPQTTISMRQPRWLGEGQLADTAVRRLEGALSNAPNGMAGILPFGRVIHRNAQGKAVLPSAAAAAATPILGVSILDEQWGIGMNAFFQTPIPAQTAGVVAEPAQVGYPQGDHVFVDYIILGDVVMQTEEAILPADIGSPVLYRYTGGTAPNNVAGRVRKSVDAGNAEALPNAKFMTTAAAGGLVVVRLGTFAGATAVY